MRKSKFKSLSFIIFIILLIPISVLIQPKQIIPKIYLLAQASNVASVTYQGNVQSIGWQNWVSDGQEAGTDNKALRLEAIKIKLVNAPAGAGIKYQTHVQNIGWQSWVSNGQKAGTEGKSLRIEGIKITLVNMPGYSIQYQGHVQNIGWQDWVSNGQEAGTGSSLRMDAIKIRIVSTIVHPTLVSINKTTDNLIVGGTDTLLATITPSNSTKTAIAWKSSRTNIAIVSITGKVTAIRAGTVAITATTTDGIKTATCSITIKNPDVYNGLILSTFGDSITAQGKWQPFVVSELGFSKQNNYGEGGTRVSGNLGNAMWQDFRVNEISKESNVILFMGGTNDWAQNVPLGTLNSLDTKTFYGALNVLYNKLVSRFPNTKIIFMSTTFAMLPNRTGFTDKTGLVNNLGLMNINYGKAIGKVAITKNIPFIDLTSCDWNAYNIATYVTYDGGYLHPNDEGGKKMAEVIVSRLREIKSTK